MSLLLKCGASTSTVDHSGSAPLHLASWKGDLEVVKMLVTQGPSYANVNQQNDSEDTGLHLASRYGYSSVIEFLLQVRISSWYTLEPGLLATWPKIMIIGVPGPYYHVGQSC